MVLKQVIGQLSQWFRCLFNRNQGIFVRFIQREDILQNLSKINELNKPRKSKKKVILNIL